MKTKNIHNFKPVTDGYTTPLTSNEKNMRYIKNTLIMISFFWTIQSFGCVCKSLGYLEEMRAVDYHYADIIFLGELIEMENESSPYVFEIKEVFKGKCDNKFIKGRYFTSCSLSPRDKGLWIVYATYPTYAADAAHCFPRASKNEENKEIEISQCGVSRSIENPDCIFCYPGPPPPPPPNYDEKDSLLFQAEWKQWKKNIKKKALADWKEELILLRNNKIPAPNN